jgi:hypothetical protein
MVFQTVKELKGFTSGGYKDEWLSVAREPRADYTGFAEVSRADGIDLQGLMIRGGTEAVSGGRYISGAFQLGGSAENAILLMSPDLRIVRYWILDEVPTDGIEPRAKYRKLVHGFEVLPDGSLIVTFDGGESLQRFDACGKRLWATPGTFSHSVNLTPDGASVWTVWGDYLVKVAIADGTIERKISMSEVSDANPEIDVLGILIVQDDDISRNSRNTPGEPLRDPFHVNDVEPLPAGLAARFPGLNAGDLLVSARSLNLVFVLDPDTLKMKWWRSGLTRHQHDPDWAPDGSIAVLDNRMGRDHSEIVELDYGSLAKRVLFDGRKNDFYSRIRGKEQLLPGGHILVSSPQQGRAFELDEQGRTVLELANLKPGSDSTNYVLTEVKWVPGNLIEGIAPCADNN